ncbi:MAG: endolytic transglycosylase MltG [Candidatus Gracilibacteria bacterium]|nr:endolytic transglycosylase MltG [Candidatus Gracilibacteria bacterium]
MRFDRAGLHKKKLLSMKRIIIGIMIFSAFFGIYRYDEIGGTLIPKQDFTIMNGDTVGSLPRILDLDINSFLYRIWIKFNYPDYNLLAGSYSVDDTVTLYKLFDEVLKKPDSKDMKVTILPGWNIFDIDAYLSDNGVIKKGDLIAFSKNIKESYKKKYGFLKGADSIEGFIYPDTYRLPTEPDLDVFLEVVFDEFDDKVFSKYGNSDRFYDNVIFASILEREEKNTINKPVVAGVLKKRLSENIALGADATVCYAYELTQEECTPTFINNYIYKKSDYNTRSKIGLPPTPISNFTDETIDAVVNSKASPYYYYLHDMNGNIFYGKTLEEHNRNKLEYMN